MALWQLEVLCRFTHTLPYDCLALNWYLHHYLTEPKTFWHHVQVCVGLHRWNLFSVGRTDPFTTDKCWMHISSKTRQVIGRFMPGCISCLLQRKLRYRNCQLHLRLKHSHISEKVSVQTFTFSISVSFFRHYNELWIPSVLCRQWLCEANCGSERLQESFIHCWEGCTKLMYLVKYVRV